MDIYSDISCIKGIGEKTAGLFNKLGVYNVGDLVNYYPRSYDSYKNPSLIGDLKEGYLMSVEGRVSAYPKTVRTGKYLIITLYLSDYTGKLKLIWFNQPYLAKTLKTGSRYVFRGRITRKGKELIMSQPQIFTIDKYYLKMKELQPVYPLCSGISNNTVIKALNSIRPVICCVKDYLTPSARKRLGIMERSAAIERIHFPLDEDCTKDAHDRLAFDEFFSFLYMTKRLKSLAKSKLSMFDYKDFSSSDKLEAGLSYELTSAQKRVIQTIRNDLSGKLVFSRLLQGDVGCGKTIVAAMCMLDAVANGYQACIMAPTDVLARQHFEELTKLYAPFNVRLVFLSGSLSAAEKRKAYELIKSGDADVVVGTHAIIQDKVEFCELSFAVIDEQHRFGVRQRESLQNKGNNPYILVMSATPIPRSLAMILYGDMEISIIDEMPKNRLPIKNCVVSTDYRDTAYRFIAKEVASGHQAYIICPMIEESEELDAENVIDYCEQLNDFYAGSIKVGYLHGRLKEEEKDEVLQKFYAGEISVLVSTTVVEVGINVPNATVMMVENAERFGLSQLHQLKGRVGRGSSQSYCIYIKSIASKEIDERLDILVRYNNGFDVAQKDLELRGPGDLKGTRQSGELCFKLADIIKDNDILTLATELINSLSQEELDKMADIAPDLFRNQVTTANVL